MLPIQREAALWLSRAGLWGFPCLKNRGFPSPHHCLTPVGCGSLAGWGCPVGAQILARLCLGTAVWICHAHVVVCAYTWPSFKTLSPGSDDNRRCFDCESACRIQGLLSPLSLPSTYESGDHDLRSFRFLQILLKEYNFDNRHKPTFTEEDILNIFPVVKHVNPKASDAFHFFQSGQAKVQQGTHPTCLCLLRWLLIKERAGYVWHGPLPSTNIPPPTLF